MYAPRFHRYWRLQASPVCMGVNILIVQEGIR
jgi:hypothetical protein